MLGTKSTSEPRSAESGVSGSARSQGQQNSCSTVRGIVTEADDCTRVVVVEGADNTTIFAGSAENVVYSEGGVVRAPASFFTTQGVEEELFLLPRWGDSTKGLSGAVALRSICALGTRGTRSLIST